MRVLFPFSYYYPEQCAGLFVVDDVMHALAAQGVESSLYVPTPTRNVPAEAKWEKDEYLCEEKIHIHRFPMYQEGKNPVLRALRYCFCELYYLSRMLWDHYDVAFIDSTPPIQGLKLPIVKLFRQKPFVYNAQDLFPDTLSGSGLAKQDGWLYKIGSRVAQITFKNVDKVIAISHDIKRGITERGVPEEKIEVIYNWVDAEAVKPVAKEDNPLFEEFGLSRDKFTVVYAGNLGNAQNLDVIMDAAGGVPTAQFVMFGSGGLENALRSRIDSEHLTNVKLLPLQPYERVSLVYSLGDVCVVSCKAGLGGSAMPSKTWSIMSCGRPVLASFDEGELKDILENNDCGVFTHAGNVDEFSDAIEFLASNPVRCQEMGAHARQFILENLTKEVGTQKYVDIIKSVVGTKKS